MVPPSDLSVELEALQTSDGPDRGCWLTGWACISARDLKILYMTLALGEWVAPIPLRSEITQV